MRLFTTSPEKGEATQIKTVIVLPLSLSKEGITRGNSEARIINIEAV